MTTFRIKRSPTSGNPATLAQGELAYSYLANNGSNGGDILYVGTGTETLGNAANHVKIGGLFYTSQIDNATSSNTASTLVKRDGSGNFSAGTITAALSGNASTSTKWASPISIALTGDVTATYSSVDGSGNVTTAATLATVNNNAVSLATTGASGNGTTATITYATQASNPFTVGQSITVTGVTPTGYNGTYIVTAVSTTQVQYANTTTGSQTVAGTVVANFGSATYIPVITVNAKGLITAISNTAISTTLALAAGGSTSGSVNLNGGTLTVSGGTGITTSVSGSTITISSVNGGGYSTTATAANTTTLTSSSSSQQYFTGTTTQTVKLPSTSTLTLGQEYTITNNSTGIVTVQTSAAGAITTIPGGSQATFTVASTGAETWVYEYTGNSALTGTGAQVLATSPTLVTPVLGVASATSLKTNAGLVSTGLYTGSYSDGIILDYDPGNSNARISAGSGDAITFYNAADATRVQLLSIGSSGTVTLTGDIVGTTTQNVFNTGSSTINFGTAATTITIANGAGTTTIQGTLATTSPNITTGISTPSLIFNLVNTTATTVNFAGVTTALNIASNAASASTLTFGSTSYNNIIKINGNGTGGTASLTTNVTTGTVNLAAGVTTGTVNIATGGASTVNIGGTGSTAVVNHLTVEGVTSTGATGTGSVVFSASPTFTGTLTAATASFSGHVTVEGVTSTGATGTNKFVFDTSPTISAPTITGHPTVEGVTSTGATGTGNFVFATSPSISAPTLTGHPTIEGVTSTGATGTGNLVFSASPTFSGTTTIATLNLSNALGVAYGGTGTTNGSITGTGALTFTAGGSNTNVNLVPQGSGTVDVGSARITSVATPTQSTDAATKGYVDAAATGINVHDSVEVLADSTNTAITGATYANGTTDAGTGTGIGATLTDATTGSVLAVDGYTLVLNDRVLVNAFTSTSAKYNGVYYLSTLGVSGTTKWVLTRATDYNNSVAGQVIPGDFAFVTKGTTYGKTGWVQTNIGTGASPANAIKIGTDAIAYTQFSGSGTYLAGNGIALSGSTFSIDTSVTVDKTTSQTLTNKTLSTGSTWNGNIIGATYGGTGVNNGSYTITLGGNVSTAGAFTTSGAYGLTLTTTNTTNVTLPTSGTLVNTAVTTLSSLSSIGTITVGTWNGTTIASGYGGTGFTTYATGDTIYASATNTLSKLSIGTTGQVMQVNSSGVPVWADLDGGTY
jgi:hypothetical protein